MIDSQAKGKRAERAVVSWLQANGFPEARRVIRTADARNADEGDVRIDGVTIEVKHYRGGLTESEVDRFMKKLAIQKRPGDVGLLVERRDRVSDVGSWWAWFMSGDIHAFPSPNVLARVRLCDAVLLIRASRMPWWLL